MKSLSLVSVSLSCHGNLFDIDMLVPRYSVVFACKVKGPKFWGSVCKMCVWLRVLRMTAETLAGMQSSDLPT